MPVGFFIPQARNFLEAERIAQKVKLEFDWWPTSLPPAPTRAKPGSKAKIAILATRLKYGYHLWHPLDVTLSGKGHRHDIERN